MTDPALHLLTELHSGDGKTLLIADENLPGAPFAALASTDTELLTNRFDVWQAAQLAGINSHFNDFNFSAFTPGGYRRIGYRVSKEKPVVHHIINAAFALLAEGGVLMLVGEKNDGLKTYGKKAAAYFNGDAQIEKSGASYLVFIEKTSNEPGQPLDDKHYAQLRPVIETGGQVLYSKPGVFGWNKVDAGSAFLVEQLPTFLQGMPPLGENATLLDLGCGYGYIAAAASRYPFARIVAIDNNAAAVTACGKNFAELGIGGEVIADDAGQGIGEPFDVILCNPPFHQGFDTDSHLTDKFLATAKRLLRRNGRALFVVNAFVPLPQKAAGMFEHVEIVAENRSYKVVAVFGSKGG